MIILQVKTACLQCKISVEFQGFWWCNGAPGKNAFLVIFSPVVNGFKLFGGSKIGGTNYKNFTPDL